MISLGGLGTSFALRVVESTRATQLSIIKADALNARQIDAFRERIVDIASPKDLVADTEVYAFVMRAFDLEEQAFGKAMIRKLLESDISDQKSLVNRLTDSRFRELHRAFDFAPGGGESPNVGSWRWQDEIINRFAERQLINNASEGSTGAGIALEFKSRVGEINSWFDVLKNRDVSKFMRTALGLPDEMVRLDIDKQAALFAKKFDIKKLRDPAEVDALVGRFSALHDALNGVAMVANPTIELMQGAVRRGGGSFVPVTIDIAVVERLGSVSRYR